MQTMRYTKPIILLSVLIAVGAIIVLGIRPTEEDRRTTKPPRKALKSLPYLDWEPAEEEHIDKCGVTVYDQGKCYNGLSIYNYDGVPEGYLIDMTGDVLHTWFYPGVGWHHVELLENGDLLAVVRNTAILKLDWESNFKWSSSNHYHHDVDVADNGDIFAVRWDVLEIPHGSAAIPIVNDYITVLSPTGAVKKEISLFDLFGTEITEAEREEIRQEWEKKKSGESEIEIRPQTVFDVFHTNTVEIIQGDTESLASNGDVLICVRNLNIIAIIDVWAEEVVWRLDRNDLDGPHQPSMVEGGILIFDNGYEREYSRVIQIDTSTGETAWEYTATPKESFFSLTRGGCQRLPNGNTLITESNKARVFEVTPGGEIVWEFYGPEISRRATRRRAIYRMTRLTADSPIPSMIPTRD